MSLTTGRGPLSGNPAGRFSAPVPDNVVYVEPFRRRVRGVRSGRTLVESERTLLVHRRGQPPAYAFPIDDVDGAPAEPEPEAPGYVRLPWDAVEAWYEEDEQVFAHPRNPYHRVDCVATGRRLRVEIAGETFVDTTETIGVYETALDPLLYVEREQVRMRLLVPRPTTTYCAYKGTASYWTAVVGDTTVEDVAWSYEDPRPECILIRGLLTFDAALARSSRTYHRPADACRSGSRGEGEGTGEPSPCYVQGVLDRGQEVNGERRRRGTWSRSPMPAGSEEFGAAVRDDGCVGAFGFEGDAEVAGVVHVHA